MSKPVAWQREDGVIAFHEQQQLDSQGFKWRSLYTHPVKQLSDEDISRIYQEVSEPFGEKRIYEIHTFARAIIKEITE